MANSKRLLVAFVCVVLAASCVSAPKIDPPQFTQRHYTFSVLYDPKQRSNAPQLELAMSLLEMQYPQEAAGFFNEVLYSGEGLDGYKDRVIREQRENYRSEMSKMAAAKRDIQKGANWRYAERIAVKSIEDKGAVIERNLETYMGGAHGLATKRYYVIDFDSLRLLKIDDIFQDYQGEETRAIVYEELRKYDGLRDGQPLSRGIFFSNEPDLTSNFFITQEGIGLHWSPYEIAPYVAGKIEIIIPWERVRPLLLNSGMELLTKFNVYLFV